MKVITTSWDDGHILDFRIAELLDKYNLQGTFYIPKFNGEQAVMSEAQMRELAGSFEIGGHTLHHVPLNKSNKQRWQTEIQGCFEWLTHVLSHNPVSFCFPKGIFTNASLLAVFESGFKIARSTELLSTKIPRPISFIPTSLQVYEHSNFTYAKHLLKRNQFKNLVSKLIYYNTKELLKITEYQLDKIDETGGCFHLWGHSWEIAEFNLWDKLNSILQLISERKNFMMLQNKQLLEFDKNI